MHTWHRVTLATGLLALAVVLGGCAATGTAQPTSSSPSSPSSSGVAVPSGPAVAPTASPTQESAPPRAGTGVTGRITVDGGCPVTTDQGCPDRPYPGRITVLAPGSTRALATTLAAKDGTYRIALSPGQYVLHVTNPDDKPFPRPASVTVTVIDGRFVTANVRLDTGIR
jgi:hypothetical protein